MKRLLVILALIFSSFAYSQDTNIEDRAKEIGQSLRCVVCQNQSIEDSDAPLAEDMRKLVRKRLAEGDSNTEVIDYMQDRYGDYVLLKPPVQGNTYALWFLPFAVLLAGLMWFFISGKRKDAS